MWRADVADVPRCSLSWPLAPPQHASAAPHAADPFFLKRSGGQTVRGSEAVRSAVSCAFFFATSCGDNFQALALTGGAARCLFDSVWRARVVTRMGLWGAAALASWTALFAAKLR